MEKVENLGIEHSLPRAYMIINWMTISIDLILDWLVRVFGIYTLIYLTTTLVKMLSTSMPQIPPIAGVQVTAAAVQ